MPSIHPEHGADPEVQSTKSYRCDKEDLLDQHVAYFFRKHPTIKEHKLQRKRPGVYILDGREVRVEWRYSEEPGQRGYLVAVDGPLRQPFSDYMMNTEVNAEWDWTSGGEQRSLHMIPKEQRLSFGDDGKAYSRLEAMKVAKEQALVRERAADYIKDGRMAPTELVDNYHKNIGKKLRPFGPPRPPQSGQQAPPQSRQQAPPAASTPSAPPPAAEPVAPVRTSRAASPMPAQRTPHMAGESHQRMPHMAGESPGPQVRRAQSPAPNNVPWAASAGMATPPVASAFPAWPPAPNNQYAGHRPMGLMGAVSANASGTAGVFRESSHGHSSVPAPLPFNGVPGIAPPANAGYPSCAPVAGLSARCHLGTPPAGGLPGTNVYQQPVSWMR